MDHLDEAGVKLLPSHRVNLPTKLISFRNFWRRSEIWFSDNCLVSTILALWIAVNIGLFTQVASL